MHRRLDPADQVPLAARPVARSRMANAPEPASVELAASAELAGSLAGGTDAMRADASAHANLLALQRSAGNRAVASLVGSRAPVGTLAVQRMDVQIDEMTNTVRMADTGATLSPGVIAMLLRAVQAASAGAGNAGEPGSTGTPAGPAGGASTGPSATETPPVPEETP